MSKYFFLLGLLLAVATSLALAADTLDLKSGLWETTYVVENHNVTIPKTLLDHIPNEQREAALAAERKRFTQAPQTLTDQSCITAEGLQRGSLAADDQANPNCTYTIKSQTRTHLEASMVCTGENAHDTQITIDVTDGNQLKGVVSGRSENGQSTVTLSGRWMSANCPAGDKP